MDDLLLFTPAKRSHIAKLEDLLKHYSRMDFTKEMSIIQNRIAIHG